MKKYQRYIVNYFIPLTVGLFLTFLLLGRINEIDANPQPDEVPMRVTTNTSFGLGEKLVFDLGYKFITAGKTIISIAPQTTVVAKRPCYNVKFETRTNPTMDKLFKVRDLYQTYIDTSGIFPWRFEQTVREGSYSRDFSAILDHKNKIAKTTEGSFSVPQYVQDVLSAFFYTRIIDLKKMKKGQSFMLYNFFGKQHYDLKVRMLGTEIVDVPAGKFECYVIEPMVVEGGLFKADGKILIYLTADEAKMPVKVSTKVIIGSIDGSLTSYSGVRGKISSKR
ncbi:MAG: DUF3108 domain-containing protein [Chlorobiota bacterium]|jgi:hypothetical protein|nr:DUF3108 domain-containing protein [Chlorobiota bacterium]QQS66010.1 MAG: DUF3108 domain-containing protein [Chlorobiota bacterium]